MCGGNKTDAADAAAICRACGDARIHDVAVKSVDQQGVLALHRARDLLVRQRTTLGNALRAHLSEFGIVAPQGRAGLSGLRTLVCEGGVPGVSAVALAALEALSSQWSLLDRQVRDLERAIVAHHKEDEVSRRLATIPGIGPITATALAATVGTVGDASAFRTGRHLAAWLGLTPREHSSGLKRRQGGIGKRGDAYLRRLLILGAHAHMRSRKRPDPWLEALKTRKPAPGGRRRARQQDRPHRLGGHGPRRDIQPSPSDCLTACEGNANGLARDNNCMATTCFDHDAGQTRPAQRSPRART